jgi:outer membrane protein assembly factor BamE (lipoprotein component of BamABCDE complex)
MKQSRSGLLVLPVLAVALCAACTGSDFQWDKARQIQPGMSQDQVSALMGSPTGVRTRDEGAVWTWTYLNLRTGSARSVSALIRDGRVVDGPAVPEGFR